jgi:hypothetical protein
VLPEALHPDTVKTLKTMAEDLGNKLLSSQVKLNLTNGWKHPPQSGDMNQGRFFTTREGCIEAVIKHFEKGDVLDVIAYLMFMRELGWSLPWIAKVNDVMLSENDKLTIEQIAQQTQKEEEE